MTTERQELERSMHATMQAVEHLHRAIEASSDRSAYVGLMPDLAEVLSRMSAVYAARKRRRKGGMDATSRT